MSLDPLVMWQAIAVLGPIAITFAVWWMHWASGYKTNINTGFITVIAGMELVDLSFLPTGIPAALGAGFAISALLANTALTERK